MSTNNIQKKFRSLMRARELERQKQAGKFKVDSAKVFGDGHACRRTWKAYELKELQEERKAAEKAKKETAKKTKAATSKARKTKTNDSISSTILKLKGKKGKVTEVGSESGPSISTKAPPAASFVPQVTYIVAGTNDDSNGPVKNVNVSGIGSFACSSGTNGGLDYQQLMMLHGPPIPTHFETIQTTYFYDDAPGEHLGGNGDVGNESAGTASSSSSSSSSSGSENGGHQPPVVLYMPEYFVATDNEEIVEIEVQSNSM